MSADQPSSLQSPYPSLETILSQHSYSPLLLAVLVAGIFLLILKPQRKGKLATGRKGSGPELRHAKRLCLAQLAARERAKIGLTINAPKETGCLYLPDLQPGAIVIGSPGTGKTFSVINPLLRSAVRENHGIILFDWKYPDQASELVPYAASHGYTVKVFAPGYAESQIFNPLDIMSGPGDLIIASEIAQTLTQNFTQDTKTDAFFDKAGTQLLESGIALAKGTPYPDLLMAQTILSLHGLASRMLNAKLDPIIKASISQFLASSGSSKTAAGIIANALSPLNQFIKGGIATSFCGSSTIDLDIGPSQMLVLGMNREQSQVCAPLIAVCLHLVGKSNLSKERKGSLVMGLDEMPTIRIPIADWLNRYRSAGLCALIGIQNIGQLEQTYGKEVSKALLGGAPTKFLFNPNELETAKMVSEYMGDEDVQFNTRTRGYSSGKRSRNTSAQIRTKRVLEVHHILKQRQGRCVAVSPGYVKGDQAYLPIEHTIRISPSELNNSAWSCATWRDWSHDALLAAAPPHSADLAARQALAEKLFPLPAEDGADKQKLSTMKKPQG